MLNYIWGAMIVISVVVGGLLGTFQTGDGQGMVEAIFRTAKSAIMDIALPLSGMIMLWLGMMRLAESAGLVSIIARLIHPVLCLLFPAIPKGHPAMGSIVMNMAANMLGLGNAATPLGLRAMDELEKLNPHPGTATNEMCMFLAINTSSVTLIPATAISILATEGQLSQPYSIIAPALMATLASTCAAITAAKLLQRLPYFSVERHIQKASETTETTPISSVESPTTRSRLPWLMIPLGLIMLGIFFLEYQPGARDSLLQTLSMDQLATPAESTPSAIEPETESPKSENALIAAWRDLMGAVSLVAIPFIFLFFVSYALLRKVPVFEEFVEGAKEGFNVALRIMPYLVAMLVALGMFRESGALLILGKLLGPVLSAVGFDINLLPMALMRPLSGSGSTSVLSDIVTNPGLAEWIKYTAATMFGSTETTFYVLAVYFGAVSIRRTRHALPAGLIADFVGIVSAVAICKLYYAV